MSTADSKPPAVRRQLERVLASTSFTRNERQSRFLRYVVEGHLEGRDNELKESLIGLEVFGSRDYDPKQDSIVRTEAGRLRARLAEYYAGEGSGDDVIIELPKGGYIPAFRQPEAVQEAHRSLWPRLGTRLWLVAALAVLAAALSTMGWWGLHPGSPPITIAVLPLENLGHDPANDYFVDGLTDELIRNLSVIEGLAVRSRTSSFGLKGKPPSVREAGKQLEVDYILEGSVLRAGQQLRINTYLVRVRDDSPLWSGKFERELTDIFAIQDEISRNVVNNLSLKLAGRRRYETSVEAYDLYLRAHALEYSKSPAAAIPVFEKAVAKDPAFAPAWAGLAAAYAFDAAQFNQGGRPPDELSKMRAAVARAIQLDPLSAEAHDALAASYARDGQWKLAEQSFRRAIQLDPNRADTYDHFTFLFLRVLGRNQEALEQMYLARKADPLSLAIQGDLGLTLLIVGRNEEAAAVCSKEDPINDSFRRLCLARARMGQGRIGEAIQILAPGGVEPYILLLRGFLGYAYARSGRRDQAERLLAASPGPNVRALILAGLGDKDGTLEALDQMAALAGPQRVGSYLYYPELAFLRDDPRLQPFRKKIGLPE